MSGKLFAVFRSQLNALDMTDIPLKNPSDRWNALPERQLLHTQEETWAILQACGNRANIRHLKSDFRFGRNFYKVVFRDALNLLLTAAAYNFKRSIRVLWLLVEKLCGILFSCNIPQMSTFLRDD